MWVYWKMVPPPDLDSSRKFSFSQGQRQYTYTVESMFVCRSDVSYDRSWVVVKRFNMNILTVKSQFSGHLSFIFLKSTSQVKPHFASLLMNQFFAYTFTQHHDNQCDLLVSDFCSGNQELVFVMHIDLMSTRARPWLVGTNFNTDFDHKHFCWTGSSPRKHFVASCVGWTFSMNLIWIIWFFSAF